MSTELTAYYDLSAEEWNGLDATAKETLADAARETLARWQAYQKSRKELTIHERKPNDHPQRFDSQTKIFLNEWKAGVYNNRLEAIVEALNIHEEELWNACHVSPMPLIHIVAKRYQMTSDEAAVVLRQTLPIFKPSKEKA